MVAAHDSGGDRAGNSRRRSPRGRVPAEAPPPRPPATSRGKAEWRGSVPGLATTRVQRDQRFQRSCRCRRIAAGKGGSARTRAGVGRSPRRAHSNHGRSAAITRAKNRAIPATIAPGAGEGDHDQQGRRRGPPAGAHRPTSAKAGRGERTCDAGARARAHFPAYSPGAARLARVVREQATVAVWRWRSAGRVRGAMCPPPGEAANCL